MATLASLYDLLRLTPLTKHIQKTASGVPNPLPPNFMAGGSRVTGNTAKFRVTYGQQSPSKFAQYGSASHASAPLSIGELPVKLLHTFEHQDSDPNVIQGIMEMDQAIADERGAELVRMQVRDFNDKFVNLRTACVIQALAAGKIFRDSSWNFTATDPSDAALTTDLGIQTYCQSQLKEIDNSTTLVGTTWDNAAATIVTDLLKIKRVSAQRTGQEATTAFYGLKTPKNISLNTEVKTFAQYNQPYNTAYLKAGIIPQGFMGFNWVPMFNTFYKAADGTITSLWPDDLVVFTPDVTVGDTVNGEPGRLNSMWYDLMEGSYLVPNNINIIGGSGDSMNGQFNKVHGKFGYAVARHDPSGYTMYAGDTFLPVFKNPDCVLQLDSMFP